MEKYKKIMSIFIILFLMIIIGLRLSTNIIIDISWFKEVGYLKIYFIKLMSISLLFISLFFIFSIVYFIYSKLFLKRIIFHIKIKNRTINMRFINLIVILLIVILSLQFSIDLWDDFLLFLNNESFNMVDPIFNKDISFYIFILPFIKIILSKLSLIIYFLCGISIVFYFLCKFVIREYCGEGIINYLKRNMYLFLVLSLIFLGVIYVFKGYNILYSKRGIVFGASYTDVNISLIFYKIIGVLCIVVSLILILTSLNKIKIRYSIIGGIILIGFIFSESVVSLFVQDLFVKANEYEYEKKYIDYNIDFTRKAFNIDSIKESTLNLKESIDLNNIEKYNELMSNLKINSYDANLQFFRATQVLRYYYTFPDLDTDRYVLDGRDTQVFLSVRELDQSKIDNSNWQSKHMYYTHGYGVVMNSVSEVNKEGQPNYLLKDLPQENLINISLENPRVYFGEKTKDYAIVNTKYKEFDYPRGDINEEYSYTGSDGIKLNPFMRILFALKEGNIRFLTSSSITSDSKILINRNILDRVKKIAPFIMYDEDPYPVINEGRLFWIIDGYTTTNKFPFSEPFISKESSLNGINYIRNSVKVVVDAYNGNVDFYIIDENDPIIKVYDKIYKGLFKDFSSMSENIKEHMKYPQTIFNIQSDVLNKYHITDSRVFFSNEDLWDISRTRKTPDGEYILNEATYLTSVFPEKNEEELVLLEYFNSRDKENMVSMFGVKMDKDNYGEMFLYKFPPQDVVFGINLFKNKYNQDPYISKEISLWDTKGSNVLYGDTLIFPIGESLLYLEPLYLKADGENSIPELKRIILYYNGKIVIGENLEDALNKVLYGVSSQNNSDTNILNDNSIKEAKKVFDMAISAQREGDWATYGESINKLGEILDSLQE